MTSDPRTYNSFEECERCGKCCELDIIAITHDEAIRIRDYIRDNNIIPHDRGPGYCPLLNDDMSCMVWPVRAQTCRLHNCHKTRRQILAEHPEIQRESDRPWINLRAAFLHGDFRDPRYI